jgi:two-component system OmpR family sensor kinase
LSRVPIRARMTAAFALAMVGVLVAVGAITYTRLAAELNETINDGLDARAEATARAVRRGTAHLVRSGRRPDDEETVTQILSRDGRIIETTGSSNVPLLTPPQARRAAEDEILVETQVPDIDSRIRVMAMAASEDGDGPVVATAQALDDRDDLLHGLVKTFAVGGPVAVVLASIVGYLLATLGLRPMEAMRRRASEVSLEHENERLPLPEAHDEVRRLGETLNDMLDRLRHSFEREHRFVADASHELRTPIAVVKTEIEGALRSGDYGPHVREALVAAGDECDHLAQLAEDLLVIAQATDGWLPVRAEQVDIAALLESVHERFADRAAQHGRGLEVEVSGGVSAWADPLRLRQALSNLVDNALRHGRGDVALRARRAAGGVEIEVADHGPGFDRQVAEHAFERFTRGDPARTRGGAGLGLAIVRSIAEAHGGRATIVVGEGATVRLWLPERSAGEPLA